MKSFNIYLRLALLAFCTSSAIALAETSTESTNNSLLVCDSQELTKRMPGVILDYVRLNAALEKRSMSDIRQISFDISQKVLKLPLDSSPIHFACIDIPSYLRKASRDLLKAKSFPEARSGIQVIGQILSEWGVISEMNLKTVDKSGVQQASRMGQ